MTDRITHEEARGTVAILADTTTPAFQLESAREGLLAYIDQQRAAETDTVSRAEHEKALQAMFVEADTDCQAKLTALQAEHASALQTRAALAMELAEQVTKLQARVAELEAALTEAAGHLEAHGAYDVALIAREHASPPPAAEASVQPAPGGVEQAKLAEYYAACRRGQRLIDGDGEEYPDQWEPTPADQPGPDEDASLDLHIRQQEASRPDYVTYDVLIEALEKARKP